MNLTQKFIHVLAAGLLLGGTQAHSFSPSPLNESNQVSFQNGSSRLARGRSVHNSEHGFGPAG